MNTGRIRERGLHVDGDALLVGVVALVVYALHGFDGTLDRDLGVFTYGGEHVAQGVPPYVGIFNSVGPLSDAVPGLAIWVGHLWGVDPVLSARLLFWVVSAGCAALLCVLARDVLGSRMAGLLAPAVFLTFQKFLDLASNGPREKTVMVLFLLVALLLMLRRRWFAAGIATALATLTWQPVFATLVAACAVALLVGTGPRLRAAGRFLAGGLVPSAIAVAYFASQGALGTALSGFVVVNAAYTRQPSAITRPAETWAVLWRGYDASLWVILAGLLALTVLAALALPQVVRRRGAALPVTTAALLITGAAAVVASVWTTAAVNGAPDLFELLPFAALGLAGAVVVPLRHLAPRRGWVLVAGLAALATVVAGVQAVATRSDSLVTQRADVAAVLAAAPPRATVLSINAPEVLAVADLTNPSGLQVFDSAMEAYLNHDRPGGLAGYAAWVARTRPTFVVVGRGYDRPWSDAMLLRDYRRVGRGPMWTWWLSRSVGAARRAAIEAANRAAMQART